MIKWIPSGNSAPVNLAISFTLGKVNFFSVGRLLIWS